MSTTTARPRVWLVGGTTGPKPPTGTDKPAVSDGHRRWLPGSADTWHTEDGRHHATWPDLHKRFDLVELMGTSQ